MLVFASPVPAAFSGLDALKPRYAAERPSVEEQYFRALAEEHERAAALARKRMEEARRRQQQRELEDQLRLQQQLAAAIQVRTPQRSPYHTPARASFGRALPSVSDILEFDTEDNESCDVYAERMHRRSQAVMLERQKRAEQQNFLRALFEEQRRTQAERVAELHRQRAEEAKAEQERQRKTQQEAEGEQARRHLAARAADEERLRQFFQALVSAMGADSAESQGAELERKNAIRRNSVPTPSQDAAPVPAPASAPASPKAPERPASPTPSVASDASDASLNSIALLQDKYNNLRSSFKFPTNLAFAPSTSPVTPASSPSLLYNPTNAPVHAYEHVLTNLLTELDAVESFGGEHVREVRRTLVRNVEAELEALEEKKRQAWRNQQGASAPAPVESTPAPAESVPVSVESAPVTESTAVEPESTSTPAESTSAPAPTDSTTTNSPNPVSWLAARLSQPSESEGDEVKAVRENLLAHLTISETSAAESSQERATPAETESGSKSDVVETSQFETAVTEPSEPAAPVIPVPDSSPEPAVEAVPEPEAEVQAPVPVTELATSGSETEAESEETTRSTQPEPESESDELVTVPAPATASESEVPAVPSSPVESVPESEVVSVTSSSEPEVIAKDEASAPQSKPKVESSVLAESESEAGPESSAPAAAPAHNEQAAFVQVFPDSDSDVDTDADLASELAVADKKSTTGGDEFELI